MLLAIERVIAAIEGLLALHDAVLHRLQLLLASLVFRVGLLLELENLLTRLHERRLLRGLGVAQRIVLNALGLVASLVHGAVCLLDLRIGRARHKEVRPRRAQRQTDDANDNPFHVHSPQIEINRLVQETDAPRIGTRHLRRTLSCMSKEQRIRKAYRTDMVMSAEGAGEKATQTTIRS